MAHPSERELRVLVVDDEPLLQEILRCLLEGRGAGVEVASNGSEAVRMWESACSAGLPYHVVITDLSLGQGMNGPELAHHLRSRGDPPRILACTGSAAHPVVERPRAFGFDACLTKPFLIHDLLEAVTRESRPL